MSSAPNTIWFQLQWQRTIFFLKIRSQHQNIKTGPISWDLCPPPFPATHCFSPFHFSSLWSFHPGYLFNLDYRLFEGRASILRGLKSIIANWGHSIKELFINKALLKDESDLSVVMLTSIQHTPWTVVQLPVLGRAQYVRHSLLLRSSNVCKSWYMLISLKKVNFQIKNRWKKNPLQ